MIPPNLSDNSRPSDPDRDPGVLAVENFLTEEQELQILKEIEEELLNQGPDPEGHSAGPSSWHM